MELKKIYLLTLIFIFSCKSRNEIVINKSTFEEALRVIDNTIEEETQDMLSKCYQELNNFGTLKKNKFFPLKVGLDSLVSEEMIFFTYKQEIYNRINQNSNISTTQQRAILQDFEKYLFNRDSIFMSNYTTILTKNSAQIFHSDTELGAKISNDQKEVYEKITINHYPRLPNSSNSLEELILMLRLAEYNGLQRKSFFVNLYTTLMETRNLCGFDIYFPVVFPRKNCLSVGDYFEAEIMIGSYSSNYNSDNAMIFVNGDTLNFNGSTGKAIYKTQVQSKGEHELILECQLMNPLTEEIISNKSVFTYEAN